MKVEANNFTREVTLQGMKISFVTKQMDVADEFLRTITDGTYTVEIRKKAAKRSLDANAYHYVLCDKIAQALGTTSQEVHNLLLADYGVLETDGDGKPIFILRKDTDDYLRATDQHLKPTDATEDRKGTTYRWYACLKASRFYDTREMSRLIDGTIEEAKALGIETMTPDEVKEMEGKWNGKHGEKTT